MKRIKLSRQAIVLIAVLLPVAGLFVFTAARSGPLAPVQVIVDEVKLQSVQPALFGIGTVEARYRYQIGPTAAGRLLHVYVDVGDHVEAGQVLGEMDPVDLNSKIEAQEARIGVLDAQLLAAKTREEDARARKTFSGSQRERYDALLESEATTIENAETKRQADDSATATLQAAQAGVSVAQGELANARKELEALQQKRSDLRLIAPVDGLIVARNAEPGSTVVAGQSALEMIDPSQIWIDARFDQHSASGLSDGLKSEITLRTSPGHFLEGSVLRREPLADAVTEELRAKIAFTNSDSSLPLLGELAEVVVNLPESATGPVVPNAALQRRDGTTGVWILDADNALHFVAIRTGAKALDGTVQVLDGLVGGERVVTHSRAPLHPGSRIKLVDQISGGRR